jgi:transcriptional regulator with XRE-family HTH domain
MARETFAQALKRLREARRMSRLDLAIEVGWESATPVSRIEAGTRHPTAETVRGLARALGLEFGDSEYLLGLAGYGEPLRVPDQQYIIMQLEALATEWRTYPYPILAQDHPGYFWMANPAMAELTPGGRETFRRIIGQRVHMFDLFCSSASPFIHTFEDAIPAATEQVYQFQAWNAYRRHLPFYQAYPEIMRDRLSTEDYKTFQEAWAEAERRYAQHVPARNNIIAYYLEDDDLPYAFYAIDMTVRNVSELFGIVQLQPVDDETAPPNNMERCRERFARYRNSNERWMTLWDEIGTVGVQRILQEYDKEKVVIPRSR